jgi:hypothetical protein
MDADTGADVGAIQAPATHGRHGGTDIALRARGPILLSPTCTRQELPPVPEGNTTCPKASSTPAFVKGLGWNWRWWG